jgi:hypothetical protein
MHAGGVREAAGRHPGEFDIPRQKELTKSQGAPDGRPKGNEREPRNVQRSPEESHREPKCIPKVTQRALRRAQGILKGGGGEHIISNSTL